MPLMFAGLLFLVVAALGATLGVVLGGVFGTVLVTLFAPFLAEFAVKLGPPEYFCLMLLAFTTVSAVLGKSTLRGLTALFIGLAMGLVGLDQLTGGSPKAHQIVLKNRSEIEPLLASSAG